MYEEARKKTRGESLLSDHGVKPHFRFSGLDFAIPDYNIYTLIL
jgi:hypothetical protein